MRSLSLTMAPSLSSRVDPRFTIFLGKSTAEVKNGNSIEFNEIIRIRVRSFLSKRKDIFMVVFSIAR